MPPLSDGRHGQRLLKPYELRQFRPTPRARCIKEQVAGKVLAKSLDRDLRIVKEDHVTRIGPDDKRRGHLGQRFGRDR